MTKLLKNFWRQQEGVTLAEVVVGLGILTIVMSTLGMSLFQAIGTQKDVADDGLAIYELRKAISWLHQDIEMAASTDLADGLPAVTSATFNWTNKFDNTWDVHSSAYSLVGNEIVRTYDGVAHVVARRVVSAAFSLSGNTITIQLDVDAGFGTTRSLSLEAAMGSVP